MAAHVESPQGVQAVLENEVDTIEVGKYADMIATRKKKLEGLDALRQLDMVIARGRRFDAPKVKKMPRVEQELDKVL